MGWPGAYVGRPELPIGNCQTRAARASRSVVVQNEELNVHLPIQQIHTSAQKAVLFFYLEIIE
jgi:hypothetical protein